MTTAAITPTIGRKLWYYPSEHDLSGNFGMRCGPGQPLDATVIGVWTARCVNLNVVDLKGRSFFVESARLVQPDEKGPSENITGHGYATWMPYQIAVNKGDVVQPRGNVSDAGKIEPYVVETVTDCMTGGISQRMSDGSIRHKSALEIMTERRFSSETYGFPINQIMPVGEDRQSELIGN